MSFRQFGGLQFASKHNAVASNYNTSNNLLVTQNVGQSNSYINFLSDISGNINMYGDLDISGNLNVSGYVNATTRYGDIAQAAQSFIAFQDSGNFYGMGTIYGALCFSANRPFNSITPTPQMVLDMSGNVGIGTTSPQYTLDVSGNINFSGSLYQNGVIYDPSGGSSQWTTNGSNIYNNNIGNVGIGTSAPAYNLDVSGNMRTTMDASINSITVGRGGGNISTNTALGVSALQANNTGVGYNTAVGYQALQANNTGVGNTAIGYQPLQANTSGLNNVAIGFAPLYSNTIGFNNVAIGYGTLFDNIAGNFNVAIGYDSLSNITNSGNTAIGYISGKDASGNSANNTFLGTSADVSSSSLTYNYSTALGYNAIIDASNQIVLGGQDPSGSYPNVKIPGSYVGIGGVYNPSSGFALDVKGTIRAGNNDGSNNFVNLGGGAAVGEKALWVDYYVDPSGDYGIIQVEDQGSSYKNLSLNPSGGNVGIGTTTPNYTLDVSGNGSFNNSINLCDLSSNGILYNSVIYQDNSGFNIQNNNPGGYIYINPLGATGITVFNNGYVGIGTATASSYALDVSGNLNTTMDASINSITVGRGGGNDPTNTSVGLSALQSNTGDGINSGVYNTAVGYQALKANTIGVGNTAVGYQALQANTSTGPLNTGINNTAVGSFALKANTTGVDNTAVGREALTSNTTGNQNIAVGIAALGANTTGYNNTAVGTEALYSNTIGYTNTALGFSAGSTITSGSNITCIGANSQPSSATVTNEITLGDSSISTLRCQVTSITFLSDARDKKDIEPLTSGITFIDQLKPVKFIWNMRDKGKVDIPDMGFIAQDLKQVQKDTGITIPNLVYESNPDRLEASYGTLLPILVKAVQELSGEVKALKIELNELKNK
jgi:hypothetical protein